MSEQDSDDNRILKAEGHWKVWHDSIGGGIFAVSEELGNAFQVSIDKDAMTVDNFGGEPPAYEIPRWVVEMLLKGKGQGMPEDPKPQPRHPIQPLVKEENGVVCFKRNEIVRFLLDAGPHDLNKLSTLQRFSQEDWEQFAQLIGYSLSGFCELSYVSPQVAVAAERMKDMDEDERDARIGYLEEELTVLREDLREPIARLYGKHPDDLK